MIQDASGNADLGEELTIFLRSRQAEAESQVADVDLSDDITDLIVSVVSDANPKYNLQTIRRSVAGLGLASSLDALKVINLLIDSSLIGAQELLELVGECGSAKEVTMSVQEILEGLRQRPVDDEEDDEDGDPDVSKCPENVQLLRLLDLYIRSIPRLKLRKKSALKTLDSLFEDLGSIFEVFSLEIDAESAAEILGSLCRLIQISYDWSSVDANGLSDVSVFLIKLLREALAAFSCHFNFNLAEGKFDSVFPRYKSASGTQISNSPSVLSDCSDCLKSLSCSMESITKNPGPGTLQLIAYCWTALQSTKFAPEMVLARTLPLLLDTLANGHGAVDESLFIILSALYPDSANNNPDTQEWDSSIVVPLTNALSMLACAHPDGRTRHIAFRTIGGLLPHLPSLLQIRVLHDFLSDESLPQLRIAAVGLLKDAVISALATSSSAVASSASSNAFASPIMLQTFGGIVLRPDPPDLFSKTISMEDFEEMDERKRLIECLSFYYVLLLRDVDNRTGVRDADHIRMGTRELLQPLQTQLDKWAEQGTTMSLAALSTAVERVTAAVDDITKSMK